MIFLFSLWSQTYSVWFCDLYTKELYDYSATIEFVAYYDLYVSNPCVQWKS